VIFAGRTWREREIGIWAMGGVFTEAGSVTWHGFHS
jgi:hypothetical protein